MLSRDTGGGDDRPTKRQRGAGRMAGWWIRIGALVAAALAAGCQQTASVAEGAANPITGGEIAASALDAPAEGSAPRDATADDGAPAAGAAAPAAARAPAAVAPPRNARLTRLVDRDVEAPDVFDVRATALWDGRPSLGGVWVASPDARDPERVIMRNPANGQFVIGALFRRERDNPGPPLQISSDAADALGILAGQPVEIAVTALRREATPEVAPAPAAPVLDEPEVVAGEIAAPAAATPVAAGPPSASPAAAAPARSAAEDEDIAVRALAALGATAARPTPAPAPAPAAAPRGGDIRVQVGIFAERGNADRATQRLQAAGIAATIREESSSGKTFWSVVANGGGPRAAFVDKVRAAGFADAYALSG